MENIGYHSVRVCLSVGIYFFAQLCYQQPAKLPDTNLHRNIYISPKWNEFDLNRLKLQECDSVVLGGDCEII